MRAASTETVRWGDARSVSISVPAASTAQVVTPYVQITSASVSKPTSWVMFGSLHWLERPVTADTLLVDFRFQLGCGSASVPLYRALSVTYNALFDSAESNYIAYPAQTVDTYARLRVQTPVSTAARTYNAVLTALTAPQFYLVGL